MIKKAGKPCGNDECKYSQECDGLNVFCGRERSKRDGTICGKHQDQTCSDGECNKSLCYAYGLEDCECKGSSLSDLESPCLLCCKRTNEGTCRPTSDENYSYHFRYKNYTKPPGTPCMENHGYCDVFRRCREINKEGPLMRLTTIFKDNVPSSVSELLNKYWWLLFITIIISSGTIYVMIHFCSYHTPIFHPKRLTHIVRHESNATTRSGATDHSATLRLAEYKWDDMKGSLKIKYRRFIHTIRKRWKHFKDTPG